MTSSVTVFSAIPRLSHHLRLALPHVAFTDVKLGLGDETVRQLSNAQLLVADPHLLIPYVEKLPATKWVQTTWAGIEGLLLSIKNKNLPYVITRFTGESFGYAMSEYVVSQIVNFERDQRKQYENQKYCFWSEDGKISNHRRISDLTIGILGLGEIGTFIAKILKTFGATVWGMSRSIPTKNNESVDKHVTTEFLPDILKSCDYIVNVMPSTNSTRGLLNGDVLKNCMEKKSVFVNIGRGSIIKESDLINALENNWISGAILDVFEEEPLDKTSKLWKFPQVTISPHVSGVSRAEDVAQVFADNYKRYLREEPLKNLIDANRGY